MGFLQSVGMAIERRSSIENPATPWDRVFEMMDGYRADSGVHVSADNANHVTAYFSGIRFIAETVAQLPLRLHRRIPAGREQIRDDPRVDTFVHLPNPEMSAHTLRETVTGHAASWGNGYMEVVRDGRGRVQEAWPLLPDRTWREVRDGTVTYVTQVENTRIRLPADSVIHIPGFGFDGRSGYSLIQLHKQALGIVLAADKAAAEFYGSGMPAKGFASVPAALNPKSRQKVRESIQEQLTDKQRLLVLEGGITYEQMGIPPGDAQFLESRKFQVLEIARILRLPPHVLYDLERATFSNIEQQSLELVVYSLTPWLRRWEDALKKDTLTREERRTLFWKIDERGLLRGDTEAQVKMDDSRFQKGTITPNEIRARYDENRIDEPWADQPWMNAAMVPAQTLADMSVEDRAKLIAAASGSPGEARAVPQPLIKDAWKRLVRGELREVRRALRKRQPLSEYYENEFPVFAVRTLKPVAEATGEDVDALVARYAYDARRSLEDLTPEQVDAVLDDWLDRADRWASE